MEVKKTARANLESRRSTFLLMGMLVALATFFVALEWRSEKDELLDAALINQMILEAELGPISVELSPEIPSPTTSEHPAEPEKPEEIPDQPVAYEDYNPVKDEVILPKELFAGDSIPEIEIPKAIDPEIRQHIAQELGETGVPAQEEGQPEFPGGHSALIRYIYQNLKYPSAAVKQRIQGRVVCSFYINKDGSISDVKVEKGVYSFLDDEALRVLRSMPRWKPGMNNGQPVKYKYYLPIDYRLR